MLFEKLLNIAPLETGDMENELSLEKQMEEEIAMEAAIDDATFETVAFESVAALDVCENTLIAMAEKECAVEAADAVAVYESFGMEAAKDVLARKAYAGWAAVKALISTLIGWLKKLFGMSVNMKKVGKSLAEKAKKMHKELNKVASKVGQKGEIRYDVRVYANSPAEELEFQNTFKNVQILLENIAKMTSVSEFAKFNPGTGAKTAEDFNSEVEKIDEKVKEWKEDTRELANMEILDELAKGLNHIKSNKTLFADYDKLSERALKAMEKMYKEIDKLVAAGNTTDASTARDNVAKTITKINQVTVAIRKTGKNYVSYADYLFTDVKKFIAKAM